MQLRKLKSESVMLSIVSSLSCFRFLAHDSAWGIYGYLQTDPRNRSSQFLTLKYTEMV